MVNTIRRLCRSHRRRADGRKLEFKCERDLPGPRGERTDRYLSLTTKLRRNFSLPLLILIDGSRVISRARVSEREIHMRRIRSARLRKPCRATVISEHHGSDGFFVRRIPS